MNKNFVANIVTGVQPDWEDYLFDIIEKSYDEDIIISDKIEPVMPKQLFNPAVVHLHKNGTEEFMSSQIWISVNDEGNKTLIVPDETSGVLMSKEGKRILGHFSGLPSLTPKDAKELVRIVIRKESQDVVKMRVHLYGECVN